MTNEVKVLSDDEVAKVESRLERFLSALTFGEPGRGNRYVESVDGNFYFEEHADNEYDAFDLLRQCPALCATVRVLRERLTAETERADSNFTAYDRIKTKYSETVNQLAQVTQERQICPKCGERIQK